MSAIDFAKIQKQMRAEAAARRKARAADLSGAPSATPPHTALRLLLELF